MSTVLKLFENFSNAFQNYEKFLKSVQVMGPTSVQCSGMGPGQGRARLRAGGPGRTLNTFPKLVNNFPETFQKLVNGLKPFRKLFGIFSKTFQIYEKFLKKCSSDGPDLGSMLGHGPGPGPCRAPGRGSGPNLEHFSETCQQLSKHFSKTCQPSENFSKTPRTLFKIMKSF